MAKLLEMVVSWQTLVLALVVFGFTPGPFLRLIVRVYPLSDARRTELIAELYAVPFTERPLWVVQQLEIALFEGLPHRIAAIFRQMSRRRRVLAETDDMAAERRKLLAYGAAIMFGTAVVGWSQQPVPSEIGLADVTQVEAAARAMRALDYQFGGEAWRDAVLAQLSWAQRLLSASCQEEVRQRLLNALVDLQRLAGIDKPNDEP